MLRVSSARLISQRSSVVLRRTFASTESGKCNPPQPQSPRIPEVKGLSNKIVCVPEYPVGFAGAAKDKEYKNPEYYCYHVDSFGDSMVELEKFRLPAPSNKANKNK